MNRSDSILLASDTSESLRRTSAGGDPAGAALPRGAGRVRKTGWGWVRIGCGTGLIALSLWALLLPPLFPYSTHAIINTKVVSIRARESGRIGDLPATRALVLKAGERIVSVTRDPAKVQRELEEYRFKRLKLAEQLDSLDKSIASRQQALLDAEAEVSAARVSARQTAEQTYKAAVEKVRLYRESLAEKKAAQQRVEPLFKDGIVTASQWSETRGQTIEAEKSLTAAESDLVLVEARVDGLRRGGSGRTEDVIESVLTRAGTYETELGGLRIQRIELSARLGEVDQQIATGRAYEKTDRTYALTTPIDGIIWRSQVVNGEDVAEGQEVADVADAKALFVEAYFRRDFMNSIAIGDRASIYLVGEERFIEGRVADIQVQERTSKEANIINTLTADSTMLRVSIEVPPGVLHAGGIGELAKVLCSSGNGGVVERAMIWLSLTLRSHK